MDSLMLTLDLILIKNSISHSPKPQLFLVLKDGAATRKLRPVLSAHYMLSIFLSCLVLSSHLPWCSYLLLKEERL